VSAKAHPRLVGAFVLGAIGLVLAAIVALSAGNWLARRDRFALYFPGSVKGLDKGAPVTFRGVKVGQVQDVQAILTNRPAALIQIEVVIEVRHSVIEVPPGQSVPADLLPSASAKDFASGLIARGIRARLKSASVLTGQKYIDLDFLPQEPARVAGLRPRYPELPTSPTAIEKIGDRAEALLNTAAELPLEQMLDDLRKTLVAAREVLESSDLRGAFVGANRSTRKMESTLAQVEATLKTAAETLSALHGETGPTAEEARQTLRAFHKTAEQAQEDDRPQGTLGGADDTRLTAGHALGADPTLQALRNLVEYLETHPEALVIGKESQEPLRRAGRRSRADDECSRRSGAHLRP
jgi:paraquat-inducible protein B